jgi:hypothetical protein
MHPFKKKSTSVLLQEPRHVAWLHWGPNQRFGHSERGVGPTDPLFVYCSRSAAFGFEVSFRKRL